MLNATSPQVTAFVAAIQSMQNQWQEGGLIGNPAFETTMEVQEGPKRLRIVKAEGVTTESPRRSVHCFIDRETGDILKAASWKAPAPRGKRGNILTADNGVSSVNQFSVHARR
jgi:hypothetical protein